MKLKKLTTAAKIEHARGRLARYKPGFVRNEIILLDLIEDLHKDIEALKEEKSNE